MHETANRSKALLEQLAWARRLATELVADAGLAEDVVQDAWVQFLTRPPRSTGSLKGWFAGVMRNLARQQGRRRRRGEDLELAQAGDDTGEATADLVARAQAQQALVEVVLGLDPPYRDVLLLRYFEDLESPAIAEKLGMPASSVRTRLQRGLALVRSKLEDRHGRSARDWLGAVLPLVGRPPRVGPGPGPATDPAGTLAASSLPASRAVVAALGIVAIAGVFFLARPWLRSSESASAPEGLASLAPAEGLAARRGPSEGPPRTPAGRADVAGEPSVPLERIDPRGESVAPATAEPSTFVEVRIDGAPAARGVVLLSVDGGWIEPSGSGPSDQLEAALDAEGRARFEGVAPRSGAVGLEPYGGDAVLQRDFARREVSEPIVLELGTARIEGRVWDGEGNPAPDVQVLLGMKIGHDYGALRGRLVSDAGGRFVFDRLPAAGFWLHAEAPGRVGELRSHGELARGEVRELDLGRPAGRVQWWGRLVDVDGRAVVCDPRAEQRLEFVSLDGAADRTYFPVDLQPDGRYSVDLVPGEYEVRRNGGAGCSTQIVEARITVQDAGQRDLLLRGARLLGTARLADRGRPIEPRIDGRIVLRLRREDTSAETRHYAALVGPEGRYSFDGVEPGRWILEGDRLAARAPVVVLLASGDRERVVDVFVR